MNSYSFSEVAWLSVHRPFTSFTIMDRNAVLGQIASAAPYAIFSAVTGILVTAATQERFGQPLWNLPNLLSAIIATGGARSRVAAFFAGAALVVSQFGINIPGNALSGGFDMAATFPKYINIRRGAYITALLSYKPIGGGRRANATKLSACSVRESSIRKSFAPELLQCNIDRRANERI